MLDHVGSETYLAALGPHPSEGCSSARLLGVAGQAAVPRAGCDWPRRRLHRVQFDEWFPAAVLQRSPGVAGARLPVLGETQPSEVGFPSISPGHAEVSQTQPGCTRPPQPRRDRPGCTTHTFTPFFLSHRQGTRAVPLISKARVW